MKRLFAILSLIINFIFFTNSTYANTVNLNLSDINKEITHEGWLHLPILLSTSSIMIIAFILLFWMNDRYRKIKQEINKDEIRRNKFLQNTMEGFASYDIVNNDGGGPASYILRSCNHVFYEKLEIKDPDIRGKNLLEVLPEVGNVWIEKFGIVASTGKPMHIEIYLKRVDKHFSVNIFCPQEGRIAVFVFDITSEILYKHALEKEKSILEGILDDTLSGYWDWCLVKNTEYLSPGLKRMFGYEDHELINSPETWQSLIFQEDLPGVMACFNRHIESHGKIPYYNEARFHHKDGSVVRVICAGRVIEWSDDNHPLRMVGCHVNITELKHLEESLKEERKLFKTTLMSMGDGVISTDRNGNIEIMNGVAEKLTQWSLEDAYGKPFEEVIKIKNEYSMDEYENPIQKVINTGEIIELANNSFLISKYGVETPIEDSAAPIKDEYGKITGAVMVFRDFTEKKERQEKIEYLSYRDQLTDLYNRRFFEEEIKRLDTERNLPITILMADVNGLKLTNDAFGHALGDKLLKKAADVIKQECRSDDIVARIGGDEFSVVFSKTEGKEVESIVKRIVEATLNEKVGSSDLSISFGWETKKTNDEGISEVLKKAEDHMYRRKLFESPSMRVNMIRSIISSLNDKNIIEEDHSKRVSSMCKKVGQAFGFSDEELDQFKSACLLHDIGKIAIDQSILNKPDKLSDEEWFEIKRHSEIGYRILSSVNEYAKIAEVVLSHHERWDGLGYPKGLKREEIPYMARILTIADTYDAIMNDRPYRQALNEGKAIEEIIKNAGSQFDPKAARTFIENVLGKKWIEGNEAKS